MAYCDGVRVLPSPAGYVQWVRDAVGRPSDLGWRDIASISTLILVLIAAVIYRLPFPHTGLVLAQGMKVVAAGTFGVFIVMALAFVAPRLGPAQTFLVYFFVVAATSTLIDAFGLLGTAAQPLQARQLVGVLLAAVGLVLARS